MSDKAEPTLDNCDCCEVEPPPQPIFNPPGQPSLQYRIDTQPTFLQRMIDALPHETVPPDSSDRKAPRPLEALTARAADDASIALLDAWAVSADVLTFYQERIANEGYLRTATDRRSVLELAREIGYELSPGVAASADLAFTIEDAVGAPRHVAVTIGTKVLSVPGPGQTPQTFETVEQIDARPEWNAFPPRRDDPEQVLQGMTDLFLAGTATQLQAGDALLFVGGDRADNPNSANWDLRILVAVEPDQPNKRARGVARRPQGHSDGHRRQQEQRHHHHPRVRHAQARAALRPQRHAVPPAVGGDQEVVPDWLRRSGQRRGRR
jgi:hypothetical protein